MESDYYAIPYKSIRHVFTEETITTHKGGRRRWIGVVRDHQMKITHSAFAVDIAQFYGVPVPLAGGVQLSDEKANEYAIENRKVEIKQRVKQSLFRKRVLDNFDHRCCLTGIVETDLLVASHIVPWAHRIDSRLDPANGLCLFTLYDSLFDEGYISFDDELNVMVAKLGEPSESLRKLLDGVIGKAAKKPCYSPIKAEYLAYHREHIFKMNRK